MQEELTETMLSNVIIEMVCALTRKYQNQEQEWTDLELVWNTSEYNVQQIRIPSQFIWLPDIVFDGVWATFIKVGNFGRILHSSSISQTYNPPKDETLLTITNTGRVHVSFNQVNTSLFANQLPNYTRATKQKQ